MSAVAIILGVTGGVVLFFIVIGIFFVCKGGSNNSGTQSDGCFGGVGVGGSGGGCSGGGSGGGCCS